MEFVAGARERVARVLTGGKIPRETGHFYAPTLVDGVADDAPISCEEVFASVVTLYEFDTTKAAIERDKYTENGLLNAVWTEKVGRAHTGHRRPRKRDGHGQRLSGSLTGSRLGRVQGDWHRPVEWDSGAFYLQADKKTLLSHLTEMNGFAVYQRARVR